jgi:hypothetical protein
LHAQRLLLLRSQHPQHLLHLLRSQHQQHLLHSQRQLLLLRRAHQQLAQRLVVVQFLHHQAAAAQFRLHLVALVALVTRVRVVLLLLDQSALQQVVRVAVQVHALAVCLAPRLVAALLALVVLCVRRLRAVLVRVVQVLVQVAQAVVLRLVAALVQVDRVLAQEHVQVVRVLVVQVVQVAVVQVAQVADNVALQKRNHVHVVVKTSTKCCRKLQRVTQQAMLQCQKASSLSSAVRLHKNLLLN